MINWPTSTDLEIYRNLRRAVYESDTDFSGGVNELNVERVRGIIRTICYIPAIPIGRNDVVSLSEATIPQLNAYLTRQLKAADMALGVREEFAGPSERTYFPRMEQSMKPMSLDEALSSGDASLVEAACNAAGYDYSEYHDLFDDD
ncbi:MAG: hypothetical protein AABX03_00985 [Nanoarchaeota archaeon]